MDARTELRRLLQQRLEAGESTIVLESLRARDVVATASALPTATPAPVARVERPTAAPARESLEERRAGPSGGSSDWRAALQNMEPGMPAQPKAPAPPARTGKVIVTPDAPLPPMETLTDVAAAIA